MAIPLTYENMTSRIRCRVGVFPGVTPEPVEVRDLIIDDVVVGSFYHLPDQQRWEFLGPWDHSQPMVVDSLGDRLMKCDQTFWLYTDGASRGNPAKGAIGAVLYNGRGGEVETLSRCIGDATNNRAEYLAFIEGLKVARKHEVSCLFVRSDSRVVIYQVQGDWKVKAEKLKQLRRDAVELLKGFSKHHLQWIPRKFNPQADGLADSAFRNPS